MWVQAVTDSDDVGMAQDLVSRRAESVIVGLSLVDAKSLVNVINVAINFNRLIGVTELEVVQLLRIKLNDAIEVNG